MHKQLNLKKALTTKGTTLAPGAHLHRTQVQVSAGEDSKVGSVIVAPLSPLSALRVLCVRTEVLL
jgi:hypothetical protein